MMIKRKIADHHGRIENIKLFDCDPAPFWKEEKEKKIEDEKARKEMEQKAAAAAENGEEEEEEKKDEEIKEEIKEPESKYITYDDESMTLYQIF